VFEAALAGPATTVMRVVDGDTHPLFRFRMPR